MKYLETHEHYVRPQQHKVNTYVLVDYLYQEYKVKIIRVFKNYEIKVQFSNNKIRKTFSSNVMKKLNPKEIKQYKLEQETNKFNL